MDELRHVERVDQLKAIANDDRRQILRLLMGRPATLTQLGAKLGRHPAWIRHHVVALERAGLVELVEERPTRGYVEKFYAAAARAYAVDLLLLPDESENEVIVVVGSDDLALDLLAQQLREKPEPADLITVRLGSLEGLIALRHGLGHAAGCHLIDAETGEPNAPYARRLFPGRALVLMTLARRQQCLITAPGNPLGLASLADVAARGSRMVNRNPGSGTRVWIDRDLAAAGLRPIDLPGYEDEVGGHLEAAAMVADGRADAAVGLRAAAEQLGLGAIPLFDEQYDLVIPREFFEGELLRPMIAQIDSDEFRATVAGLPGYDAGMTGAVLHLAV
jgi:putative molybdopterin biosynthesis protein